MASEWIPDERAGNTHCSTASRRPPLLPLIRVEAFPAQLAIFLSKVGGRQKDNNVEYIFAQGGLGLEGLNISATIAGLGVQDGICLGTGHST